MSTHDTVVTRVGLRFIVDDAVSPPSGLIHDALRALTAVEIEAPSPEVAELYADEIRRALERAGNEHDARLADDDPRVRPHVAA